VFFAINQEMTTNHLGITVPMLPILQYISDGIWSKLIAKSSVINKNFVHNRCFYRSNLLLSPNNSNNHTITYCYCVSWMIKEFLFITIYKLICTIEVFCNVTTIIFCKCKLPTRVKMFVISNFQNTIVKYRKFFFQIEHTSFKRFNRHFVFKRL
jgi:hypothetical protein